MRALLGILLAALAFFLLGSSASALYRWNHRAGYVRVAAIVDTYGRGSALVILVATGEHLSIRNTGFRREGDQMVLYNPNAYLRWGIVIFDERVVPAIPQSAGEAFARLLGGVTAAMVAAWLLRSRRRRLQRR